MEESLTRAGQFVIETCTIHTSAGHSFDLMTGGNVVEITLSESVTQPFINGDLTFHNEASLSNIGPIIGQETLELVLRTPSMKEGKDVINFTENNRLYITRVNSRKHIGKGAEVLSVHFISSEWVRNTNTRISRSFEGNISSMVYTMLDVVGCQKLRQIEASAELKKFIAPNMRPFDIIKLLTPQAISRGGGDISNTYMFFENKHGYHFRSLNSMINGNSAYISKDQDILHYRKLDQIPHNKGGQEDVVQMLEHIIDYSTTHGDRMERNVLGHLSSKTISHNIYTKSYSTKIYDYIGDYDKHTHIYDDPEKKQAHPIYSASKDLLGKRPGEHVSKTFLQPDTSNTDGKDTSITNRTNDYVYDGFLSEAWLPDRTSQVGMLLNGLTVEMKVHGNTFTNAGDMVRISVPYQGVRDGNNPSETDKFISGRFLVKTINHVFTVATFTHEMDLTCVKDSINYELDFIENGTPDGDQQPRHREVYEDFYL